MMSRYLEVLNDTGSVMLDDTYQNLYVSREIQITKTGKMDIKFSSNEVLAIIGGTTNNSTINASAMNTPTGCTVWVGTLINDLKVYVLTREVVNTGQCGLLVWDANGKMIFNSNAKTPSVLVTGALPKKVGIACSTEIIGKQVVHTSDETKIESREPYQKPVQKTRQVQKTRRVQKTRLVTKYRHEYKSRTVYKPYKDPFTGLTIQRPEVEWYWDDSPYQEYETYYEDEPYTEIETYMDYEWDWRTVWTSQVWYHETTYTYHYCTTLQNGYWTLTLMSTDINKKTQTASYSNKDWSWNSSAADMLAWNGGKQIAPKVVGGLLFDITNL